MFLRRRREMGGSHNAQNQKFNPHPFTLQDR